MFRMSLVSIALVSILFSCSESCPRIDIAGVPGGQNRSPDCTLPLDSEQRQWLDEYLEDDALSYQEFLDALSKDKIQAVNRKDLEVGGSLGRFLDDPSWLIQVHDARFTDHDLGGGRVQGWVVGEYLFVFYWSQIHSEIFVRSNDSGEEESVQAWRFEVPEEELDVFQSLLIFPKQYAVATGAS